MKRVLMIATVPSMIGQFNMGNIKLLLEMDYKIDVACNYNDKSIWTKERIEEFKTELEKLGIQKIQIDFVRTPYNILKLFNSYKEVKHLVEEKKYTILHCHTPIAGIISRFAAQNSNTKIIYTAHGFHFFKGAPLKNWILYYPIEKICSSMTDILITINREDYFLAKKKFHMKHIFKIPGIGVDTIKFSKKSIDKEKKCKELGIPLNKFILLSVGELAKRKNQIVVIKALHKLNNPNIVYLVVGEGVLKESYQRKINKYKLQDKIKLLGFRTDIVELCNLADCFIHPSLREGLGIAPLEAMSTELPLISSCVNGMKDYVQEGVSGYCINPKSVSAMAKAIKKMYEKPEFRMKCAKNNAIKAHEFDISKTENIMRKIYNNI